MRIQVERDKRERNGGEKERQRERKREKRQGTKRKRDELMKCRPLSILEHDRSETRL